MLHRSTNWLIVLLLLLCMLTGIVLVNVPLLLSDESISAGTQRGLQLFGMAAIGAAGIIFVLRRTVQRLLERLWHDAVLLRRALIGWQTGEPWLNKLMLAGFTLLGAVLRLLFINQPIRTDEAITYLQFASKPLYLALSDYAAPNNHLLHTLLVHLSTRLFGNAEWAIRLPAFAAGVLLIPLTYLAVRRLFRSDGALLAAGLVAASSVWIEYSTNARGYTLQAALFLLILTLAVDLRHSRNTAAWGLFALLNALAFYALPTMLYGFGMVMLWLILSIMLELRGTDQILRLKYWFISGGVTAGLTLILYTPVLIVSGLSSVTGNPYVTYQSDFWQKLPESLVATWTQWHRDIPLPVVLLLVTGFGLALLLHQRIARFSVSLFFPAAVWITAVLLLQRVVPFTRVWLFLLPIYFGMAAAGLAILPEKKQKPAWLLLTLIIPLWGAFTVIQTQSPYTSTETGTFRDAEPVTLYLQDRLLPGDKVIYEHPSGESLMYYFMRHEIPATYHERDFAPHEYVYLVLNQEYPQTTDSVLRHNGQNPLDYTVELIEQFPLSALYRAEYHPD